MLGERYMARRTSPTKHRRCRSCPSGPRYCGCWPRPPRRAAISPNAFRASLAAVATDVAATAHTWVAARAVSTITWRKLGCAALFRGLSVTSATSKAIALHVPAANSKVDCQVEGIQLVCMLICHNCLGQPRLIYIAADPCIKFLAFMTYYQPKISSIVTFGSCRRQ